MTPSELIGIFADVAVKLPAARKEMRKVYADAIAAREKGATATLEAIQAGQPVSGGNGPAAMLTAITFASQLEVETNQGWIEEKKRVFEIVHDLEEIRKNAEKIAMEMVNRNGASNRDSASEHDRNGIPDGGIQGDSEGASESPVGDGQGAEVQDKSALRL